MAVKINQYRRRWDAKSLQELIQALKGLEAVGITDLDARLNAIESAGSLDLWFARINTPTGGPVIADTTNDILTLLNGLGISITGAASPTDEITVAVNESALTHNNIGGILGLAKGGTNADLSATGGASQVLRQSGAGAAITVSQLAASDLSNGVTGSGAVVLEDSPTITTPTIASFTNAQHNHQNAAGGGTLDAAAIAAGTLDSARLATKNKTISKILYLESPAATDVIPMHYLPDAGTIIAIRSVTDAGTVTFNIEQRGKFTPATAGTDCMTSDQVADTTGEERTSGFADATVPADNWLVFVASAVSSATKVWVNVEYTVD